MHLIKPKPPNLKWNVRLTNHDGTVVRIPGDRDRLTAQRMGEQITMLIRAKQNGDPPPVELKAWIDAMPVKLAERLIGLGLLANGRRNRSRPLAELIVEYGKAVAARKSNRPRHAFQQENKVRRVFAIMKITSVAEFSMTGFQTFLAAQTIATSTRRSYIITMKDFCKEMMALGVIAENSIVRFKAPGQYENPEYERQPLTVEQFQKLMTPRHVRTVQVPERAVDSERPKAGVLDGGQPRIASPNLGHW